MSDEELANCSTWFCISDIDGSQMGPFDVDHIWQQFQQHQISMSTLMWCQHLNGWQTLEQIPFLLRLQNTHSQSTAAPEPGGGMPIQSFNEDYAAANLQEPESHVTPISDIYESNPSQSIYVQPDQSVMISEDSMISAIVDQCFESSRMEPIVSVISDPLLDGVTDQFDRILDSPSLNRTETFTPLSASIQSLTDVMLPTGAAGNKLLQNATNDSAQQHFQNSRIDSAIAAMDSQLEGLSHRRVPLLYPLLDLNRFMDDLESTGFMSLSEEIIISQMYCEISKERNKSGHEGRLLQNERISTIFRQQATDLVLLINQLEVEMMNIVQTAQQVFEELQSNLPSPGDVIRRLESARTSIRSEMDYCRRCLEKHVKILSHPCLFVFYQSMLFAIMQLIVGIRLAQGVSGPAKDRYKQRISKDQVLMSLVKKGLEFDGTTLPVPKGSAATEILSSLDRNVNAVHSGHIILRTYFKSCSQFARMAAGIQICADSVAEVLCFRYEEQIRQLVPTSAHQLAEYGVRAMCLLLNKGSNVESQSMIAFLVASVQDEVTAAKGSSLFSKKQKLDTSNLNSNDTWNCAGIYRKTGLKVFAPATASNSPKRFRYFQSGFLDANPTKYGYRLGSDYECVALKMVETPERVRLDMQIPTDIDISTATIPSDLTVSYTAPAASISSSNSPTNAASITSKSNQHSITEIDLDDKQASDYATDSPKSNLLERIERLEKIVSQLVDENVYFKSKLDNLLNGG